MDIIWGLAKGNVEKILSHYCPQNVPTNRNLFILDLDAFRGASFGCDQAV